jgi:hypothetical protein
MQFAIECRAKGIKNITAISEILVGSVNIRVIRVIPVHEAENANQDHEAENANQDHEPEITLPAERHHTVVRPLIVLVITVALHQIDHTDRANRLSIHPVRIITLKKSIRKLNLRPRDILL